MIPPNPAFSHRRSWIYGTPIYSPTRRLNDTTTQRLDDLTTRSLSSRLHTDSSNLSSPSHDGFSGSQGLLSDPRYTASWGLRGLRSPGFEVFYSSLQSGSSGFYSPGLQRSSSCLIVVGVTSDVGEESYLGSGVSYSSLETGPLALLTAHSSGR